MGVEEIIQLASNTGNLWAILFVYLFLTNRKESNQREQELMSALKKTNEQHLQISNSMQSLEKGMETLSTQFRDLSCETRDSFSRVWEKFGEIK